MQTEPATSTLSDFHMQTVVRAVPMMMELATEELGLLGSRASLPPEITSATMVAMVLEDVLPLLGDELGIPGAALLLQCALLDQLELLALVEAQ